MEKKLLTARFDAIDPCSIESYIEFDGYKALKKALTEGQDSIIDEVKASQLKGRGGAGFPTGVKLQAVKEAVGMPKYVICNADEGEPGNFKDRYLMEKDPHQLIEGMIISAYTVGSHYGYIYIRGEYKKAARILKTALDQARVKGFLGDNILDTGFDFDIEIHLGAGSYVCGEEFALLSSLEGNYGRSDYKPPFPTTSGLFNKPTLLNNVETLSNIPHIVLIGGLAYSKLGTESSKGTKLVCVSGHVNKPGLYEVEFGVTFKHIIYDLAGGITNNSELQMVQLAGASGPVIPKDLLELRLDYKEIAEQELSFGSGAFIVMNSEVDMLDVLRRTLEFFHRESCGKCTPCREGITQAQILLDRFIAKTAKQSDLDLLKVLLGTISISSMCGLGQAAPTSLLTALKFFPDAFSVSETL